MRKIKKGDDVIVIAGKDNGKRGSVLRVTDDDRVVVEGCNMVKKHVKPNPNTGESGGIVKKRCLCIFPMWRYLILRQEKVIVLVLRLSKTAARFVTLNRTTK